MNGRGQLPNQLVLPFAGSLAPDQPALTHELRSVEHVDAVFVRNLRARRYVLRVRPDGTARVTIPRGGSRREAERFLAQHGTWLARERGRLRAMHERARQGLQPGDALWFRGARVRLIVDLSQPVAVVRFGDEAFERRHALADLTAPVERHLRALAVFELPARVATLAASTGLSDRIARVVVRDQRSRWGSCSTGGTINLNWRLIQMPDAVRDYVIYHELMHLQQANHSRRFWALVHRTCPWYREAQQWLRRHGRELV